jgi:Glycosyl hydrolases family 31 TIM-barrel domain/Glycosyl hydrolase family 31 C-terminal domain/Domain of unknown function (DUF5110)
MPKRIIFNLILITVLFFTSSLHCIISPQINEPDADSKAKVISGDVRFTILTPRQIRLEWDENKNFEDHASFVFVNRKLPVPDFITKEVNGWLIIQTKKLTLKYKINSGSFNKDNLSIRFEINSSTSDWHPGMKDTANLLGTIRTLDGVNGSTPLESGLLSRDGWTLIDDSQRPLFSSKVESDSHEYNDWNWVLPRAKGKRQDWYFFGYGHDYKQQLYDFTRVAGKIPLPPKFAFGTWWSRYWNYTDEELKDLINQFYTFDVPLDVLVVDMDWHKTQEGKWDWGKLDQAGQTAGWTGYSWNKDYFPNPKAFLNWTEKEGLRVTLNLHPASGIQPGEDQYQEMAKAMGIEPASKTYIPFDITNKKFTKNYFNIVIHPLEKLGVDFWWLDWQQWHTTEIPGVTPTWWLNYVFFTDMEEEGKRPILFHRWGGLGNHRYQIGFSGDTYSTWGSLAFQPYFTATASNVGFGYWSHDIGGHMPGPVLPELYTRWIQFSAFSPILRTHASKNPKAERRIWAYPYEYFKIMRDTYILRYKLIPYIYTAAREAYDSGVSLCRPMYYDYPNNSEAYNFKDQYMFGDDILAAPIASQIDSISLTAKKRIWLPEGNWFELYTGTKLKGPAVLERNYLLDEIPVFVKAGSILPMQLEENGAKNTVNPIVLKIFPGDSGSTKIYEDNGNSLDYKNNQFTWTKISQHTKDGKQIIEIFPVEGSYMGMINTRAYKIVLPGILPPQKIVCNNKELEWRYDGNSLTVSTLTPEVNTNEKAEIEIFHSRDNFDTLVNGFPRKLSRIKKVKELIYSQSITWNISEVVSASQTGRRITLNPNNTAKELIDFKKDIKELKRILPTTDIDPQSKKKCLIILKNLEAN